ncbi:MAG TPA: VTT domain-containing protein [Solirubrobacteraceae bacterium]|nr:VTT domain-containing protein [Solirubrobacteraceae bacterium]
MSGHELDHLIHLYGCGLVFSVVALQALGAPLPGTTALIAAALYAATTHGLPITGVIAAGAGGALTGTCGAFALGRWRGPELLHLIARRLGQSPERVERLRAAFAAGGPAMIVLGRFVTGLRNVTGLLAGASAMDARRFVVVSAGAAALWATINGLEYYWFGRALQGADTWVQVVLVVLGLVLTALTLRHVRRRIGRVPALTTPPG